MLAGSRTIGCGQDSMLGVHVSDLQYTRYTLQHSSVSRIFSATSPSFNIGFTRGGHAVRSHGGDVTTRTKEQIVVISTWVLPV